MQVLFGPGASGELERTGDAPGRGGARWHPSPGGESTWIRADGRHIRIADGGRPTVDDASRIRQALPFTAALQGRLMLHAAAVAARDGIHAFVGPSGAGKSTLARQLARREVAVIADDLLLCLERRARVVVPVEPHGCEPLAAVYFLERTAGLPRLRCTALSKKECFLRLLRNGFGELAVAEAWAHQFHLCRRIAGRARGFELEIPDDPERLPEAAGTLIREHLGGGEPAPRTSA